MNNVSSLENIDFVYVLVKHYNNEYEIIGVYDSRENAKEKFTEVLDKIWHTFCIGIDDNYRSFQDCINDLSFRKYNDWVSVFRYEVE